MAQPDEDRRTAVNTLAPLLYTPRREHGVTCAICTEPTGGTVRCGPCSAQLERWGDALASIVVPLTYASDTETQQIRHNLREYKSGATEHLRQRARVPLSWLTWWFGQRHLQCLARAAGGTLDLVTTVPSGRAGRVGAHPVEGFAGYLGLPAQPMLRTRDAPSRSVAPSTTAAQVDVAGRSIVVLDDTWVTGASAQGSAVALKQAGARWVGIVTLGRWTNDSWSPTHDYFATHRRPAWDPTFCPVEGRICAWS